MSGKEKRVPKRRFKEFENAGEWEERKLKDILSIENGFAFKSEFFQEENSSTIVLTPGNVAVGGGFQNDKGRYYNVAGIFPKQFIFNPGDIFVTMTDLTPSAQTLGFPAIVPNDGIEYLHNQRLGKIISYDNNNLFLFYLLCTDNYHNYIVSTASGTTVKHTSPERILDHNFYIPQKDEQCKIASCFKRIDNLIILHQRKLEKMKALKKAYLTEMFPTEGERKPKLRFAEFTGDWEQRKLEELSGLITKGTTPLDKSGVGNINFIKIENIDPISGKIMPISKITTEEHEGYLKRSQLQENDLLFSIAGTLGRVTAVNKEILPANTNQALAIIRLNTGYLDYIMTYLKGKAVSEYIKKNPTVGAQPNLSLEQVSNLIVSLPKIEEQKAIGTFFKNLNNLITLHQRKLEKLQNIKKAYLNEMFI
ncbi:restriction endonuclease subunit S [Clostridium beijerinckii]|uniref:restriction endonuclease subunit S n=1 Tax=Clostridium beijerinckii TaxID=1520 RepID=UPI00156FA552|nr:restriction endonuclease subunit S [Clostridium beijerinckii]NRT75148.1 type I restriction enzyme S subunit [Clostridium beijerinckii]